MSQYCSYDFIHIVHKCRNTIPLIFRRLTRRRGGGGGAPQGIRHHLYCIFILVGNARRDMLPLISEYAKVEGGGGGGDYARNAGADSRTPVFLHMLYMHQIVYACIDL
jgi:hypothetical protein